MMSRRVSPVYLYKGPNVPVFEVPVNVPLSGMAALELLC